MFQDGEIKESDVAICIFETWNPVKPTDAVK